MLEVTYIFHSGFVVEATDCILVFDYWMDPSGVMQRYATTQKPVYVLASHFHQDHFNRQILEWRRQHPGVKYTYLLSKDILKHRRAEKDDADVWLVKGNTWHDEHIHVTATGSNDSGVSWIVEVEGQRLFHAGDLCNWYARFLAEEDNVPERIYSEEFGEINPKAEEKQFLGELKDVKRYADSFDIVMFPVDGRIGNGYTLGGRQFIERFKVGLFIPMHFVASGFESAWRMEPFCEERGIPFWCIGHEGERLTVMTPDDTGQEDVLLIRQSRLEDIDRLHEIFARARAFRVETGNPNQWTNGYPSTEFLERDIASGDSYVCLQRGKIEGTFLLRGGEDPTYNIIQGEWPNDLPYATIHRIASSGRIKGLFHTAMRFALRRYDNIRIDTHRDNQVMQQAIQKEGFKYCGIIYCWSGEERLGFQFSLSS